MTYGEARQLVEKELTQSGYEQPTEGYAHKGFFWGEWERVAYREYDKYSWVLLKSGKYTKVNIITIP